MPMTFYSQSGTGAGAVPFQRIVEPSQLSMYLNLEQAELLRINGYNERWRFYFGKHWTFKRESGEPLVTLNYFRKIIDKAVEFLVSKGFTINTPSALEYVTKPFLDEVWEYNKRQSIVWDYGTTGGVTGDVFTLVSYEQPTPFQQMVNPFSQGRIRINLLGSEQVFPTWDPLNVDTLLAVRIETLFHADKNDGAPIGATDEIVNANNRQLMTKRFTQIITPQYIMKQFHGEPPTIEYNALGEIPLVHISNISVPREYYGLSDGQDIIEPQREINEKCTDVSDIINYHASPITAVFGAKAKNLDRGPRNIWTGLPEKARIETVNLPGDLTASKNYIELIKKVMHELSDTPEGALGAMQPISNTSGVALHMQYQPLIGKTDRKRATYEPGFEQINYFILRTGMVAGLIRLPFDLCKNCGGRIVELPTGKMERYWDPAMGVYNDRPSFKRKCFTVDPQTLEFEDPMEMRLKFWRQYGFGVELRDMTLRQIIDEIKREGRSFWDYTVLQEGLLEKWRKENASKIWDATPDDPKPTKVPAGEKVIPAPEKDPNAPPDPTQPQVNVAPPKIEPPPTLRIQPIPELDIPEEPEMVALEEKYIHPVTGEVVDIVVRHLELVPTGCRRPMYLNPFENEVFFNDVLPKDEAMRAELFGMYLDRGLVDIEWCQERIPEIAEAINDIRRRAKKRGAAGAAAVPAAGQPQDPNAYKPESGPLTRTMTSVPGPDGNATPMTQQLQTEVT